jgi:RNA recognition motif-containing protein
LDYGYVNFKKSEDALAAMTSMNKKPTTTGSVLLVTQHISRQQNMQHSNKNQVEPVALVMKKAYDSNVFVNFIPVSVTEVEFAKEFGTIGKIVSLKLSQNP